MAKNLLKYDDVKDKISHTVDFIENKTGLKNVGKYITAMLELDAFFLNEDRHTNNIAFILNDDTGEYRFCPYFDFDFRCLPTQLRITSRRGYLQLNPKIHAKPLM